MSMETVTKITDTYKCDCCGVLVKEEHNPGVNSSIIPVAWAKMRIQATGDNPFGNETMDMCPSCSCIVRNAILEIPLNPTDGMKAPVLKTYGPA